MTPKDELTVYKAMFMMFFYTMLALFIITFMVGCTKHNVRIKADPLKIEAPEKLDIGPDFEKAAAFCDSRYLPDINAAEDCFQDYRAFYQIKVGFDLDAIIDFCSNNYSDAVSTEECINDLVDIIDNAIGNGNNENKGN